MRAHPNPTRPERPPAAIDPTTDPPPLDHEMIWEDEALFKQPAERAVIALALAHRAVADLRRRCRGHECPRAAGVTGDRNVVADTIDPLCQFCEVLELTDGLYTADWPSGWVQDLGLKGMAQRLCALATVSPPAELVLPLERKLARLLARLHGEAAAGQDDTGESEPAPDAVAEKGGRP